MEISDLEPIALLADLLRSGTAADNSSFSEDDPEAAHGHGGSSIRGLVLLRELHVESRKEIVGAGPLLLREWCRR